MTGEEEEECGIVIGRSSSASCWLVRLLLRCEEKCEITTERGAMAALLKLREREREREVLFGSFVKCLAAFDK